MARTFYKSEPKPQEKLEPVERVYRPLSKMVRDNFIGGIAWALGATVGLAIVLAVLKLVLDAAGGLPVVGQFIASIVESTNQHLQNR